MKIATWNLERPGKSSQKITSIIEHIASVNPDILVLTETNDVIDLGNLYNSIHSSKAKEAFYKEGERRVSIYSKYKFLKEFETFRNDTAICVSLQTPMGELTVYGTVIGICGNREETFITDLDKQLADFGRLAEATNFCISGDLNMTFSDNYYYTNEGRQKLNASFEKLNLVNLTADIPQNIDHIIITKSFIENRPATIQNWNLNKKLSDHIGIAVTL